jgi:TPR repeat protein
LKEKYKEPAYKSLLQYHSDWLKMADEGDANSQYIVGKWFYGNKRGVSIEECDKKAFIWFKKAALQGLDKAIIKLASCYEDGRGVEKKLEEAEKWYKKAADKGNKDALYKYISLKYNDNLYKLLIDYWFTLLVSADKGDSTSQFSVGEWLHKHSYSTEAIKWYKKAAKKGKKEACLILARSYLYGMLERKNVAEAVKWFEMAGEISAEELCDIGNAYDVGDGIFPNFFKAFEYYNKAANMGNDTARYHLGLCYEKGNGVEKDINTAKYWYGKAATQGNEEAKAALERLKQTSRSKFLERIKQMTGWFIVIVLLVLLLICLFIKPQDSYTQRLHGSLLRTNSKTLKIDMTLNINGNYISGTYHYINSGNGTNLNVSGKIIGNRMELNETDFLGQSTGHFVGIYYKNSSYNGTFTNSNGNSWSF